MHDAVRPARPADAAAVRDVTDAAYRHYIERIGIRPAPMDADHEADIAAGRVRVTGEPLTGVLVLVAEADHLFVESVAVHPDGQGRGVGRRLLDFADARARELRLPEIRLCTNALMWENQYFYQRHAYEITERRVDGPYDRIHYRKRL